MGSGSQRMSGLDFEHRQNESGASVTIYGDVPLLQQLNTDKNIIILNLKLLNIKNINTEKMKETLL